MVGLPFLPKILLISLISLQVMPLQSFPSSDTSNTPKVRVKRNLGQLIALTFKETNYKFMKLANYGNWCGKGGDLMGDGSFVDGCDLCCKKHDNCYNRTRSSFVDCIPLLTVYNYRNGETYPEVSNGLEFEDTEEIAKKKLPACNTQENEAPSCKESVCQCDMEFIMCLKTEPCPPERVAKRGGYWFLPF